MVGAQALLLRSPTTAAVTVTRMPDASSHGLAIERARCLASASGPGTAPMALRSSGHGAWHRSHSATTGRCHKRPDRLTVLDTRFRLDP